MRHARSPLRRTVAVSCVAPPADWCYNPATPMSDTNLASLHAEIAACRKCNEAGFFAEHTTVFAGPASARLMVVGQAPASSKSTPKRRPFSGSGGRRLFRWLREAGWEEEEFRALAYFTAITKCYPGPGLNGKGDRAPTRREQTLCRPFLDRELALIRPAVIVPIGRIAIEVFLGRVGPLEEVIGREFTGAEDSPVPGVRLVPLPHPSGASLWLNRAENQAHVQRAVGILAGVRMELFRN
ncbi:MAG: uracil-DNA glycosylase family protein [Anaerolineae bacterium]|nr:uracil-DNA glycosylase family protein [Anaerolineae bacterium]